MRWDGEDEVGMVSWAREGRVRLGGEDEVGRGR